MHSMCFTYSMSAGGGMVVSILDPAMLAQINGNSAPCLGLVCVRRQSTECMLRMPQQHSWQNQVPAYMYLHRQYHDCFAMYRA